MQFSRAISKSGKKIIKVLKKLSPQARLAKKQQQLERDSSRRSALSTRKNEQISMSWWALQKPSSLQTLDVAYEQCTCCCCCCQFACDENLLNENLENENLRNENIENETRLAC